MSNWLGCSLAQSSSAVGHTSLPQTARRVKDVRGLRANLCSKKQYLNHFHILCHQVLCLIKQGEAVSLAFILLSVYLFIHSARISLVPAPAVRTLKPEQWFYKSMSKIYPGPCCEDVSGCRGVKGKSNGELCEVQGPKIIWLFFCYLPPSFQAQLNKTLKDCLCGKHDCLSEKVEKIGILLKDCMLRTFY